MRTKTEYAVYKGDKFLTIGTLHEIADYLGITYGYIFVKLEGDKK